MFKGQNLNVTLALRCEQAAVLPEVKTDHKTEQNTVRWLQILLMLHKLLKFNTLPIKLLYKCITSKEPKER